MKNWTLFKDYNKNLVLPIAALFCVVLLPSILLSKWFPLDLGGMFEIGALFSEKLPWIISPYNGSGRYFPVYWLFSSLQYYFFTTHALPYFLLQSIILTGAIALTCKLVAQMTGRSRWITLLAVLLFFNTPIAENSATMGKAEPLSYFLIFLAIYMFAGPRSPSAEIPRKKLVCIAFIFGLALLTKETSLALMGLAASGFVLTWIANRYFLLVTSRSANDYAKLFGALVAGWVITKIPYIVFWDPADIPTYLDYKITLQLIKTNFVFYASQQADVLVFAVLGFLFLTWRTVRLLKRRGDAGGDSSAHHIFMLSLYAMGLAYYVVLMAWRWPMAYYMLIPSVIFRMTTIYGLYFFFSKSRRKLTGTAIGIVIGASIVYSAAYLYYIVGSQISYSRLYTQAVKAYAQHSQGRSALIMENYPFYAEQVTGTHLIMRFAFDKWFRIGGVSDLLDGGSGSSEIQRLLGISDARMDANIDSLPKKNDFVLVFTGRKLATWFLRGVTPFIYEESAFTGLGTFDVEEVATNSIAMPAAYFNIWTGKPEIGLTRLGFRLYKVVSDGHKFFWRYRYADGWVGAKATLLISEAFGRSPILKLSSPSFVMPNRVTITKDGEPYRVLEIKTPDEIILKLDEPSAKLAKYEFTVDRTVAPADIGLNQDTRKLGILIGLEPPKRLVMQ
jgi:hypothetical protein